MSSPQKPKSKNKRTIRSKPNRLSSAEGKIRFWFSRKTAGTNAIYQSMTKLFPEKSKGEQDLFYTITGVNPDIAYFAHLGEIAGGIIIAMVLVRIGKIRMDPWEKSLLEIWGWNPPKKVLAAEEEDDEGWIEISPPPKPVRTGVSRAVQTATPSPAPIPPKEDPVNSPSVELLDTNPPMIRFRCPCGGKIKVPADWAGKKSDAKPAAIPPRFHRFKKP